MRYRDLRDFMAQLELTGDLRRVGEPVSPHLEMTALCDRVLRAGGPALLFERPTGHTMPVLANLFGTPARVARAMGVSDLRALRSFGEVLAALKEPEAPKGLKDMLGLGGLLKTLWHMAPRELRSAPCQEVVWEGADVDLARLPVQHCWPGDVAPLVTWGLVITQGPHKPRQNLGIYRQQVLSRNQLIMRWLAHRGGALDFRDHAAANPGQPYPVAVALGADPATILGAVTPVPDSLSEYQFAGLLRGARTDVVRALGSGLRVPATAEIVLEGHIYPDAGHPSGYQHALEGPFGDHTGYYNEQASFPVFTVDRITLRRDPIYHSTYTGKPPDEPAVLGMALNELFIPLLQRQFPEITDFYLPPEGCSYRMALVRIVYADFEPARLQVVSYRIENGTLTRRESLATRDLAQIDLFWKAALSDNDPNPAVRLQTGIASMNVQIFLNGLWIVATPPTATNAPKGVIPGLQVSLQADGMEKPMVKSFLLGGV